MSYWSWYTYYSPPQLLAIIPGTGPTTGGQTVMIIGSEFDYGTVVFIGGNQAFDVFVIDSNHLTCTTPAHAAGSVAASIIIANTYNPVTTASKSSAYTYTVSPPTVLSINPNHGDQIGGESVIIRGTGFVAGAQVLFGGTAATDELVYGPNILSCTTPAHPPGFVDVTVTNPDTLFGTLYSGYRYDATPPDPPDLDGWWWSPEGMAGGTELIIGGANPKHARDWGKLTDFSTILGGSPGPSVIFRNHLIYAGGDYALGDEQPTIRIFDGLSDRLMNRIPDLLGDHSQAILSMLLQGDIIYMSTFDGGTTSADYVGRVFGFDPLSETLFPIGVPFPAGELPYALAWHMDRLWVGTNKGDGTAGKIYFYRPGIDTAWTLDHNLSTESLGGVTSMLSFDGDLYVGTDGAAGTYGSIVMRGTGTFAGTYLSEIGSGGAQGATAAAGNGFLRLIQFQDTLFATYWNPLATKVALVYSKAPGDPFAVTYTGAGATLRPYMMMFEASKNLYVAGGGPGYRASLIRTPDVGDTWDELSAYLAGVPSTALPVFGLVGT